MWVINPASALLADGTRTRREMAPIKFIFPPKMVSVIIGRFLSHWYIVYMVIWCYKNGETARSTAGSDLRRFGGTSVPRLYTTPECSTRSGYSSGAIGHIYLGCEPFFLSSVSRFQTTASTNWLHRRRLDSCFPWTRPGQADKQPVAWSTKSAEGREHGASAHLHSEEAEVRRGGWEKELFLQKDRYQRKIRPKYVLSDIKLSCAGQMRWTNTAYWLISCYAHTRV